MTAASTAGGRGAPAPLRLNQGDPSEVRSYYCPHYVAARLGLFERRGVEVVFVQSESGGRTVQGGQIPAVVAGDADLTIGGPMVTMKMLEDGGPRLVSFCACVARNPWALVSGRPWPDFELGRLRGQRVLDISRIGTATLALNQLLTEAGLSPDDIVTAGSGNEAADLEAVQDGRFEFGYLSLHALAPALAAGRLVWLAPLAGLMGPVPWSAYIARPETLVARAGDFAGFTRAIADALAWIVAQPATAVARLVADDYPDIPRNALAAAIGQYQAHDVLAATPRIARADFDRFAAILGGGGWLRGAPPYSALVETRFAEADQKGGVT